MGLVNLSAFSNINDFWWNNFNDHLEIVQFTNSLIPGTNLPTYNIHPWSDDDKAGILERHQQYHNDIGDLFAQFGVVIQSSDLEDVDFDDPGSRDAWIYQNYQFHLQARVLLGM